MARTRYFIEGAKGQFYDEGELDKAKARARSLSKRRSYDGVYIIAERFDADLRDYEQVGSLVYFNGYQDAREGIFA